MPIESPHILILQNELNATRAEYEKLVDEIATLKKPVTSTETLKTTPRPVEKKATVETGGMEKETVAEVLEITKEEAKVKETIPPLTPPEFQAPGIVIENFFHPAQQENIPAVMVVKNIPAEHFLQIPNADIPQKQFAQLQLAVKALALKFPEVETNVSLELYVSRLLKLDAEHKRNAGSRLLPSPGETESAPDTTTPKTPASLLAELQDMTDPTKTAPAGDTKKGTDLDFVEVKNPKFKKPKAGAVLREVFKEKASKIVGGIGLLSLGALAYLGLHKENNGPEKQKVKTEEVAKTPEKPKQNLEELRKQEEEKKQLEAITNKMDMESFKSLPINMQAWYVSWVKAHVEQNEEFKSTTVVDKENSVTYVFDTSRRIIERDTVILGEEYGNDPNEKSTKNKNGFTHRTQAGVFELGPQGIDDPVLADGGKGAWPIMMEDPQNIYMHDTLANAPGQHQADDLRKGIPANLKKSWGCIRNPHLTRISKLFYEGMPFVIMPDPEIKGDKVIHQYIDMETGKIMSFPQGFGGEKAGGGINAHDYYWVKDSNKKGSVRPIISPDGTIKKPSIPEYLKLLTKIREYAKI